MIDINHVGISMVMMLYMMIQSNQFKKAFSIRMQLSACNFLRSRGYSIILNNIRN